MSTRHSSNQEVTKGDDMELPVVRREDRGRCNTGRDRCDSDMYEGSMMKHDNVKLGRVSDVAQHSHAYDYMCVAGAEGYVWRGSMTSQGVGTEGIGREISRGREVNTDDTMVEVCLSSNKDVLELEYDRSMVVEYGDTKRYIGRDGEYDVDGADIAKTSLEKGDVTTSLEKTEVKASLMTKVKLSLGLAKTETKSKNGKYDGKKSNTWIKVWLLLSIASWKVYLQEQEKYLWRVREFDSWREAKLKGSVIHSVVSTRPKIGELNWSYKAYTLVKMLELGRVLERVIQPKHYGGLIARLKLRRVRTQLIIRSSKFS